jgi:serine/threonine-protein kinase
LLEQAHQRAPNDAMILAAFARANTRLSFFTQASAGDGLRRALDLAKRAVAAAPERGEALVALAQVRFGLGEWVEAAELASRAVARSPLLPEAHELIGRIRLEVGPRELGLAATARAHGMDPLVEAPVIELAKAFALDGDFSRAREFLKANPPAGGLVQRAAVVARIMLWSKSSEAWSDLLPPLDNVERDSPAMAAVAAHRVLQSNTVDPEVEAGLMQLANAPDLAPRFRTLLYQIAAEFHACVGNVETSLERLEVAVRLGLIDIEWLDRCPLFGAIRTTPKFSELRREVDARAAAIRAAFDR